MKKAFITTALLATFASSAVMAKDIKTIEKTLDVDNGQTLSFNVAVGSLEIETCKCNEVSLKIKVEPSDGNWSLFSSKDVDDAELTVNQRSSGLRFEVDEKDTKQKWTVTVPHSSALNIEVGVGHVEVQDFENDLDAEVGVGHISVDLSGEDFDSIKIDTGVGDAAISSLEGKVKNKRAMVSDSARYSGNGKYNINLDVGVGDANVNGK